MESARCELHDGSMGGVVRVIDLGYTNVDARVCDWGLVIDEVGCICMCVIRTPSSGEGVLTLILQTRCHDGDIPRRGQTVNP